MSDFSVTVQKVHILPHPDADRLELAEIGGEGGFICVVGKGQFQNGDLAIYIPSAAILPDSIMEYLAKTKIHMKDRRLRAVRIRGVVSEGLCLKPEEWLPGELILDGADVTKFLQIQKYESPLPPRSLWKTGKGINMHYENPNFPKYTNINRIEQCPGVIKPGEFVVATIKMHGMNFRCGIVEKPEKPSWFKKMVNKFLGRDNREILVGSHNKIRKPKETWFGHYIMPKNDLFWNITREYQLEELLPLIMRYCKKKLKLKKAPDIVLFGELIGAGIQRGYDYGYAPKTYGLRFFDIMVNGKYLDYGMVTTICLQFGLPMVEPVFLGPFSPEVLELCDAIDEFNGRKFRREGIVIKPVHERKDRRAHRVIFKKINPQYLLDKTNSEYH